MKNTASEKQQQSIAKLFTALTDAEMLCEEYLHLQNEAAIYLGADEIELLDKTAAYGAIAHEGIKRASGEAYFTHPIAVAHILAEQRFDIKMLQAALLHDVLEDTAITYREMAAQFGDEITKMVDGVSKFARLQNQEAKEAEAESFKKMLVAMTDDPRVIIIKLADRLHNMRTSGALRPEKRIRKAKETLDVYASIANRLGLFDFRMKLEDLAFKNIYPWRFAVLQKHYLDSFERNDVLNKVTNDLLPLLQKMQINAHINKRQRHLWGVYQRMKRKTGFAAALRANPIRIITDNEDDCYRVLGLLHSLYRPIVGKFEDFIATPKINGYRSLHTTMLMKKKDILNVQIRTHDMHILAENGTIAILYQNMCRENIKNESHNIKAEKNIRDWLSSLKEVDDITNNPLEYYEAIKEELYSADISVYSSSGDLYELPQGATAVDFAYAVSSRLGQQCVGAIINGVISPVYQKLRTAQSIEIITDKNAYPNINWLSFVVTAKARAGIRYQLNSIAKTKARALGQKLLEYSLQRLGMQDAQLDEQTLKDYARGQKIELGTLFYQIGKGERQATLVAGSILGQDLPESDDNASAIIISSAQDDGIHFSKCCYPLPKEEIIGEFLPGLGVNIHRKNCSSSKQNENYMDWIRVKWSKNINGLFRTSISIVVKERPRMLAEVATVIGDGNANILDIKVKEHQSDSKLRYFHCLLEVRDNDHLIVLFQRLNNIEDVSKIRRL